MVNTTGRRSSAARLWLSPRASAHFSAMRRTRGKSVSVKRASVRRSSVSPFRRTPSRARARSLSRSRSRGSQPAVGPRGGTSRQSSGLNAYFGKTAVYVPTSNVQRKAMYKANSHCFLGVNSDGRPVYPICRAGETRPDEGLLRAAALRAILRRNYEYQIKAQRIARANRLTDVRISRTAWAMGAKRGYWPLERAT